MLMRSPAVTSKKASDTVPDPPWVTVTADAPTEVLTAAATALGAKGGGTTVRSVALKAEPIGVSTPTFPDDDGGTTMLSEVVLALVICANWPFTNAFVLAGSKFVPVMVSVAPGAAIVGVPVPVVKLEIVGAAVDRTVKGEVAATVPDGVVTEAEPVVAPLGTATVSDVAVTAVGVADTPLKLTDVFDVFPNAVPAIVTVVPTAPALGDT
jgi:hypothetical protein